MANERVENPLMRERFDNVVGRLRRLVDLGNAPRTILAREAALLWKISIALWPKEAGDAFANICGSAMARGSGICHQCGRSLEINGGCRPCDEAAVRWCEENGIVDGDGDLEGPADPDRYNEGSEL